MNYTDAYAYKPLSRQIRLLTLIRENVSADNDLAIKACGSGKFVVMRDLGEIIETLLKLEHNYLVWRDSSELWKGCCQEYANLLGGYNPESLQGERAEELKALVKKWEKQDEEEEAHDA